QYVCQYCGATFVNATQTVSTPVAEPKVVAYCPICGGEIVPGAQKCRHCGEWLNRQTAYQPTYVQSGGQQYTTSKSKVVAALLAFFLGCLGIHEFYLGRNGAGVAFLLTFLLTSWMVWPMVIMGLVCLIQTISFLCMSDQSFAEKYH
ncbi:MAG: TM2 domain-containing protein, partial [Muribaculaceae bacterium]|nr:TM2 domain-containing protein [Muribaculaceae bacterium]